MQPHKYQPYKTDFFWRGGLYNNITNQLTDNEKRLFANMIRDNAINPPCRQCGASERNPRFHT